MRIKIPFLTETLSFKHTFKRQKGQLKKFARQYCAVLFFFNRLRCATFGIKKGPHGPFFLEIQEGL
ncbi:MAG: hypothetical protein C0514_06210 [Candidatus Puniceispirillum sp.]|nr:hypothetical protein [Candidatus Puniceispirillum sp.]